MAELELKAAKKEKDSEKPEKLLPVETFKKPLSQSVAMRSSLPSNKGVALKLDRATSNRQEKNELLNAYFNNKKMLKS